VEERGRVSYGVCPVNILRQEWERSFCPRGTSVPASSLPPSIASKAHNPFQITLDWHAFPRGDFLHDLSSVIPLQCQTTPHTPPCPLPQIPHAFCASVTIWGLYLWSASDLSATHMAWAGVVTYFIMTHIDTGTLWGELEAGKKKQCG